MILLVAEMQRTESQSRPAGRAAPSSRRGLTRAAARSRPCSSRTARCTWAIRIIAGTDGRPRPRHDRRQGPSACRPPARPTPVEIIGLSEVPDAGDVFNAVEPTNAWPGSWWSSARYKEQGRTVQAEPVTSPWRTSSARIQEGDDEGPQHHRQGRRAGLARRRSRQSA